MANQAKYSNNNAKAAMPHEEEDLLEKSIIDKAIGANRMGKDKYNIVFLIFLLHGIGTVMPWNLHINAKDYYSDYKLNTNISSEADYRLNFMNYIGLAAQIPNLLLAAFNLFFQPTKPKHQSSNDFSKLLLVITIEIIVCFVTLTLAILDSNEWPRLFFDLTIISIVVLTSCTGVYQSVAFRMVALLPMAYSNAIILGNNMCGTIIAVVNIVCKMLSAQDLQLTAIGYFSFAIALLACCLGSVFVLPRMKFYNFFQSQTAPIHIELVTTKCDDNNISGSIINNDINKSKSKSINSSYASQVSMVVMPNDDDNNANNSGFIGESLDTAKECFALCSKKDNGGHACRHYWLRYWLALRDSWVHYLSVWSVYFCTLSCFPVLQSQIKPIQFAAMDHWFTDIFVFLFLNTFAMVGNIVSNFYQFPPPRWLALVVWIRTFIFIPFFLFCNCYPDNRVLPVLITSDEVFIIGNIIFSLSSGYLSSLCMMYAPKCVKNKEYAGLSAMVATFFLILGIVSGISFGAYLSNTIQVK